MPSGFPYWKDGIEIGYELESIEEAESRLAALDGVTAHSSFALRRLPMGRIGSKSLSEKGDGLRGGCLPPPGALAPYNAYCLFRAGQLQRLTSGPMAPWVAESRV